MFTAHLHEYLKVAQETRVPGEEEATGGGGGSWRGEGRAC